MSIPLLALLSAAALAGPYDEPSELFAAPAAETSQAGDISGTADPFRWVIEGARVSPGDEARLELKLLVPAGTHLYRDMLSVSVLDAGGLKVGKPDFPPGRTQADPANGGKPRELYDLDVIIYLPFKAPKSLSGPIPVRLGTGHQGCREGLCFPPGELEHDVVVTISEDSP